MARMTPGEEFLDREFERLHGKIEVKNTYTKVTYQDGRFCICEPKDVPDMTAGSDGFRTEEVRMTRQEFEALPEFQR